MEVACGEHGDYIQKLVVAVNAGRCNKFTIPENYVKIISNDIEKNTAPEKATLEPLAVPNGSVKTPTTPATCTTSLLDSSENLPQSEKNGKILFTVIIQIISHFFCCNELIWFLWSTVL